jgi:signal transduction histidine kinase
MKASAEQSDRLHRFAHDLRNRLAAIQQALAQMADASSEERIELIRFAEQQYFKAMRGTEELLDDFAIDRGPRLGELRLLRLDELARKAIAALEHRFSRKRQHVDAENLQAIAVHGDDRMLFDLVSALLSNASKFSEAGSTIALSLTEQDGAAILVVKDQGIGLEAEDLAEVFTRYALLKGRSTEGEAQGRSTLARAKQWARAHGGDLTAASEGPRKGSSFSLRLPLARI